MGQLARALHHAVGLPERRGREQRDGEPPQGRRQELHRPDLEPRGQGAVRQELRHQRLRERPEPRRARRDVAGRKHHGRHAHRRHLLGLEGLRRRDGAGEDRADARRVAVLRSRRDGGEGESCRSRDAGACTGTAGRPWRRAGGGGPAAARPPALTVTTEKLGDGLYRLTTGRRQLRLADRRVQGLHHDARGRADPRRAALAYIAETKKLDPQQADPLRHEHASALRSHRRAAGAGGRRRDDHHAEEQRGVLREERSTRRERC